jgi:hypothetical protein
MKQNLAVQNHVLTNSTGIVSFLSAFIRVNHIPVFIGLKIKKHS